MTFLITNSLIERQYCCTPRQKQTQFIHCLSIMENVVIVSERDRQIEPVIVYFIHDFVYVITILFSL